MKKLSLRRETIKRLESSDALHVAGGFSGITTCVACNVTKVPGGCIGAGTSGCPQYAHACPSGERLQAGPLSAASSASAPRSRLGLPQAVIAAALRFR